MRGKEVMSNNVCKGLIPQFKLRNLKSEFKNVENGRKYVYLPFVKSDLNHK